MDEITNTQIGFLDLKAFSDESVRAGLMVSDIRTRPLEFCVTSAVKPSTMQKILYGKVLKPSMYNDTLGLPLLTKSTQEKNVVFVKQANFLQLRPNVAFPIALLYSSAKLGDDESEREHIFQSIKIDLHPEYRMERDFVLEIVRQVIVVNGLDLFEPFDRVQIALNEVHAHQPEKSS